MRVGVIAGTLGEFHPSLNDHFKGVDLIVHAGAIGNGRALDRLETLAPVRAVVGHEDFLEFGDRFPETLELKAGGARLLVSHMIGTPPELLPPIQRRLAENPPDVIIHGHAPMSQVLWIGGTLFLSPGHATRSLTSRTATCAILDIAAPARITAHVLDIVPNGHGVPYDSNPFFRSAMSPGGA